MTALLKMERKQLKPCVNHVGTLITTTPQQPTPSLVRNSRWYVVRRVHERVRKRGWGMKLSPHVYIETRSKYMSAARREVRVRSRGMKSKNQAKCTRSGMYRRKCRLDLEGHLVTSIHTPTTPLNAHLHDAEVCVERLGNPPC